MSESCEHCRFYFTAPLERGDAQPPWGRCRRFPPQLRPSGRGNDDGLADQPAVTRIDWCGEFDDVRAPR